MHHEQNDHDPKRMIMFRNRCSGSNSWSKARVAHPPSLKYGTAGGASSPCPCLRQAVLTSTHARSDPGRVDRIERPLEVGVIVMLSPFKESRSASSTYGASERFYKSRQGNQGHSLHAWAWFRKLGLTPLSKGYRARVLPKLSKSMSTTFYTNNSISTGLGPPINPLCGVS